jgi:hypothetical protein
MRLFDHLLVPAPGAFDFMADMAAREAPSRLKRRTPAPARSAVAFPLGDGTGVADLYLPGDGARAGLLLVPGVAREGKDDPRLVAFATTLARLGFAVLVPELATLRDLNVRPWHRDVVKAAFAHLVADPAWAPGGRAGIGGLSFAMGPGVIAALDPAIRERVRFLFCIGGYYDLMAEMKFVTTGAYRERGGPDGPGPWRHMAPDHYGRWVLAASLADHVADDGSRAAIRAMIERRLPDAEAPITDLVAEVADPAGHALLAFCRNTDPARFDELHAALPAPMREDLAAMDVARQDLSGLHARLILVHGLDDDLIPYVESQALHRAAPPGRSRVYLVRGLNHVNMGRPGPLDAWRLLSSVTALLAERGPAR